MFENKTHTHTHFNFLRIYFLSLSFPLEEKKKLLRIKENDTKKKLN